METEEERFHKNVNSLKIVISDEVKRVHDLGLTTIKSFYINFIFSCLLNEESVSKRELIEMFISETSSMWNQVAERDVQFIVSFIAETVKKYKDKSSVPIGNFGDEEKNKVLNLFEPPSDKEGISKGSMRTIWKFFDSLVIISIKFVHRERGPVLVQREDKSVKAYKKNVFPMKLSKHASVWGVKLEW